jgi:Bacterial PH domain
MRCRFGSSPIQPIVSAMREPTEIRQPAAMRIYFVFFGLLWVGALLVPYGIRSGSDALLIPLVGVVGVAFIARIASLRVLADESGLRVRNFFRTQHFPWEEIEDFRLGRPMSGLPFGWVIHVLLTNEEVVTLDVTASSWSLVFGGREKREQVLNTLREWLRHRN